MKKLWNKLRSRLPRTYWGIPVDPHWEDSEGAQSSKTPQRGVALLIAVLAVAMIMIFSTNMIINSQVNLELALSQRDSVKAEYMAKSAFHLATFLITGDLLFDLEIQKNSAALAQAAAAGAAGGLPTSATDSLGDFWGFLNGLPIGGESLEMISSVTESFELNAINDEDAINILELFDGQFVLDVQDEGSRINLNQCVFGRCKMVMLMLESLMTCPAERIFLEKKDLTPKEMAYRIKDWIDDNKAPSSETGYGSENDPYGKYLPPYQVKKAPFDTLDELKLVEGWDEDMHTVFAPYLTVYPFVTGDLKETKVNINTADKALLGCLMQEAKVDCNEKFQQTLHSRQNEGSALATDAAGIKQTLQDIFCVSGSGGNEKDESNKENWFTNRSDVFRIKTSGIVGYQQRTIEIVLERLVPDKAKKINQSYKILYWKLI